MSEPQSTPVYSGVVEFVENYLSPVYRRQVADLGAAVWCPEWWQHAEAVARLDAVWRAWEHLRLDGRTGLSVWFLDHADPHLNQLFDQHGAFEYCGVRNGHRGTLAPLPLQSPQQGVFSDPGPTPPDSHRIYDNVVEFVENYLSLVYRRQVIDRGGTAWCRQWWQHAEAVARLDALWRAWEHYRHIEHTGLSTWFLDHADPHMNKLLSERGPFRHCDVRNGHRDLLHPLPLKTPGAALFDEPAPSPDDRTVYSNVLEFVENYLSLVYRRQVDDLSDTVWCPEWWQHAEAVARLDSLWRSWEHYRLDPDTGLSVWFLDHADPHMYRLTDPHGAFQYCGPRNGHRHLLTALPLKSPGSSLFRDPEAD